MDQNKPTMFAGKAVAMADVFKYTVGKDRLEGSANYTVQMAAPEGESTGGGLAAMQHIALVPDGGGPSVVIGSANQATGCAELRTHAVVAEAYRKRFKGTAFPTVQWTSVRPFRPELKFVCCRPTMGFQTEECSWPLSSAEFSCFRWRVSSALLALQAASRPAPIPRLAEMAARREPCHRAE